MSIDSAQILVIDDELGLREGLRRLFTPLGHCVDTAATGEEGILKGTQKEYDLYFIDLRIGDVDGAQVLGAIKEKFPEAICIIITGYASIDTAITTTRLGAYFYLTKPFMPDEVNWLLKRALARRVEILETRRLREEQARRLLEVAQEKSRLRTLINAIDDGILIINQQGEAVFANPRFHSLLDLKEKIPLGTSIRQFLPENLLRQIDEILQKKEQWTSIRQELVIRPPAQLVVMANTTPILDQGQLLGVVSVLRDISELKQLELLKSQFINMAAHELKAPLTAIHGYLEMMRDRTIGNDLDLYTNYIHRSLERTNALIQLINDLLNISRIEAGKIRREIEAVDLTSLLRQIFDFYKNEMMAKNISLTLALEPSLIVQADREEMQRVFGNLISNAIKYNRPNGSISIRGKIEGFYVRIDVQDSGIGMTPEEKSRLFEEFFRAKNPYTRQITGTGLGLAIVKKIVDHYAGKITVESQYEQGSCFSVFLPIANSE